MKKSWLSSSLGRTTAGASGYPYSWGEDRPGSGGNMNLPCSLGRFNGEHTGKSSVDGNRRERMCWDVLGKKHWDVLGFSLNIISQVDFGGYVIRIFEGRTLSGPWSPGPPLRYDWDDIQTQHHPSVNSKGAPWGRILRRSLQDAVRPRIQCRGTDCSSASRVVHIRKNS